MSSYYREKIQLQIVFSLTLTTQKFFNTEILSTSVAFYFVLARRAYFLQAERMKVIEVLICPPISWSRIRVVDNQNVLMVHCALL